MKFLKICLVLFLLLGYKAFAQGIDKVIMVNGDTKEGKVLAVTDTGIKFAFKGETLEYEIKKSDISRIVFASGRVEIVSSKAPQNPIGNTTDVDRTGKIAILPVDYSSGENTGTIESMRTRIQSDAIKSIKQNTTTLQVQDPMTTNSLLSAKNIKPDQLTSLTPHDMAVLLGVEYVVYTSVNIANKGASTFGSNTTIYNSKETTNKNASKNTTKNTGSDTAINSSTTTLQYETHVSLSMYNDKGANVYSESRQSFGSGLDAYVASLNYLIKRCPFGTKAKR